MHRVRLTSELMRGLQPGDIVALASSPNVTYMVTGNYGDHVTAVRSVDMTNPSEWIKVIPQAG